MGLKTFRPLTPSLRWTVLPDFEEITKHKPERSLTVAKRRTGGRNNLGRMTTRGIGGGHKQRYRIIDFKRDKIGVSATVEAIEYDPNRSARIALLKYEDGEKRYIIAPMGLEGRGESDERPRRGVVRRQRASAEEDCWRRHESADSQHRVAQRQGRPALPQRRQWPRRSWRAKAIT